MSSILCCLEFLDITDIIITVRACLTMMFSFLELFVNVVCYMSMSLVCSDSSVFTLTSVSVRVKHVSLM